MLLASRHGVLWAITASISILIAVVAGSKSYFSPGIKFPLEDEVVVKRFSDQSVPDRDAYLMLTSYFTEGFVTYASPLRASAAYPGQRSGAERSVQNLEAFSRVAPLLAIWLASSQKNEMRLPSGRLLDIRELLMTAIASGTDPGGPEYWGNIGDHDQRVVEAADIALAIWIVREKVWGSFDAETRSRILAWLRGVNGRQVVDNNWHLFIAQVNVVLKALGEPYSAEEITWRLDRVRSFYQGNGWFRDGPDGAFDYYNAWGFHYQLGWIHLIDPELMPEFIADANDAFANQLLYLVGIRGFPIMGRSICYRLAVTAPLLFAAMRSTSGIAPTDAKRSLDATWQYFARNGGIKEGRITQGYCGDDPRILDDYSGPGSCLWSLRSLIAALAIPADSMFWVSSPTPLPIEKADYQVDLQAPGFHVTGVQATGNIVIATQDPLPDTETRMQAYTLRNRVLDFLRPGIRRPDNEEAKYRRAEYSSDMPFCGCEP